MVWLFRRIVGTGQVLLKTEKKAGRLAVEPVNDFKKPVQHEIYSLILGQLPAPRSRI